MNFSLLDGTVAKLKSRSQFDAEGNGRLSFTIEIDLASWKSLQATAQLGTLSAVTAEQARLQQNANDAAGSRIDGSHRDRCGNHCRCVSSTAPRCAPWVERRRMGPFRFPEY